MADTLDYYLLLGIARDASQAEIRWAYERAVNRAHRDGAHRHMTELSQAFDTLSDPRRRSTYDRHGMPALRERSPGAAPLPPPWRIVKQSKQRYDVVPLGPGPRRHRRDWRRLAAAALVGVVAYGVVTAFQTGRLALPSAPETPALQEVVCDAAPGGLGYSYTAAPGQPLACANGAAPRVIRVAR